MPGGRSISLVAAGEEFLADFPTRFNRKTRDLYQMFWRQCQALHPDKRVTEFTEKDLLAFAGSPIKGGKNPSPNTVAARIKSLRQLFTWAQWKGIRTDNPALMLQRLVGLKVHNQSTGTWLAEDQMKALLASVSGQDVRAVRDRLVLRLGLQRGLRASEMTGLVWSGIDFGAKTISGIGKGSKPFTLKMPAQLVEDLFLWRSLYIQAVGREIGDLPVLVPLKHVWNSTMTGTEDLAQWGQAMSRGAIHDIVERLGPNIGVDLNPHDLRRSFAGWLEAKGRPYLEIARELRHSNVAVTHRYLEGNPHKPAADVDDLAL